MKIDSIYKDSRELMLNKELGIEPVMLLKLKSLQPFRQNEV